MFRNFSLIACLFAFSFFAPVALAESVGCGNTCSTSTQSVQTEENTSGDTTLLEWFFGDTSE